MKHALKYTGGNKDGMYNSGDFNSTDTQGEKDYRQQARVWDLFETSIEGYRGRSE